MLEASRRENKTQKSGFRYQKHIVKFSRIHLCV
jgi:hypothetical protein